MEHWKTHSVIGTKAFGLSLTTPSWPSQHDQPTTLHTLDFFRIGYGLSVALHFAAWVIASLLAVASFEVTYYFCPDVQKRSWRWFTPGGLIALLGWIAGSMGVRVIKLGTPLRSTRTAKT